MVRHILSTVHVVPLLSPLLQGWESGPKISAPSHPCPPTYKAQDQTFKNILDQKHLLAARRYFPHLYMPVCPKKLVLLYLDPPWTLNTVANVITTNVYIWKCIWDPENILQIIINTKKVYIVHTKSGDEQLKAQDNTGN
ncbi:uncharacterized protein LACBIDRAFT_333028 [Laccaria bicolor S238N-H82]|uniref:Predicted protein n=1 Tax=Laccaria bicolor (strain S238N-H82 / ATCC MYA-4686) TaxID=486041 RepID=B0DUL8_LACBS|nr:uncharacterized protein LACBIDRAFT_333028 [Laccaria bicolor S238N-H82]EDR01825.1 predicted protein [Laccaria bicolor S238N-H82]|eukprot:XP_001887638.1 predicted protein [Laccaria bicolor S238N-H82]